jgi:hypothetical protein
MCQVPGGRVHRHVVALETGINRRAIDCVIRVDGSTRIVGAGNRETERQLLVGG